MNLAVIICGPIASGKSTAISYLASEFDLKVVSFGRYVRAISKETGGSATREELQDLGDNLLKSKGAEGLLKATLEHACIEDQDTVIFDGVRHPEVLTAIRRSCGTTVAFYMYASQEERHRRYNARQSSEISFEEFLDIDSHPVEIGVVNLKGTCELGIDTMRPFAEVESILSNEVSLVISTVRQGTRAAKSTDAPGKSG